MFKKIALATLFTSALLMAESGVGININQEDFEVEGVLDSRNLAALQTTSTIYQADFNFLNIKKNDQNENLMGLGIGATNKVEGFEGVELTFGAKFIWSEVGSSNFTALPLMGKIRYEFPPLMYNIPPVGLEAKALYASPALAFGDSEKYSELRFAADIEMIENVRIYVGYRNIHTGYEDVESELFDNSYYAGLKFTY